MAADTLSRMKSFRGTPYTEALLTSQSIEEYDEIDQVLRPYIRVETNMQFEKRRQELEDTLIKLEMLRGNDYEEVIRICTNKPKSVSNPWRSRMSMLR